MARTTNTRRRQNGRVGGESSAAEAGAPSLVDSAEQALHNWLAGGRYRQGDRLPPEHEVAAMLGVSRGTLRSALQRLEESGEIVRRQGSGTFVGRVAVPTALDERLERLEPYSSLASRRGLTLSSVDLRIERRAVGVEVGEALGLAPIAPATDGLADARGQRRAGRGDVRRRAPQRDAARRRRAPRGARARADGARRADRARRAGHVRAHARDPVAAGTRASGPASCSASAARPRCSSSRS